MPMANYNFNNGSEPRFYRVDHTGSNAYVLRLFTTTSGLDTNAEKLLLYSR